MRNVIQLKELVNLQHLNQICLMTLKTCLYWIKHFYFIWIIYSSLITVVFLFIFSSLLDGCLQRDVAESNIERHIDSSLIAVNSSLIMVVL